MSRYMKEKRLMTSFFLANAIDTAVSPFLAFQEGWKELGPLADIKIEHGEFHEALILKTAFSAVLIGSYALAAKMDSRWKYPTEQALKIGNVFVWGVQVWNAANILTTIAQSSG